MLGCLQQLITTVRINIAKDSDKFDTLSSLTLKSTTPEEDMFENHVSTDAYAYLLHTQL